MYPSCPFAKVLVNTAGLQSLSLMRDSTMLASSFSMSVPTMSSTYLGQYASSFENELNSSLLTRLTTFKRGSYARNFEM